MPYASIAMSPYADGETSKAAPFVDIDVSNFLKSTGTNPTATGWARYQKIGTCVRVHFKLFIASVGTGNFQFALPLTMSSTFSKPFGLDCAIHYNAPDKHHMIYFNNVGQTSVNLVYSATYGATTLNVTPTGPNALSVNDVISGILEYQCE